MNQKQFAKLFDLESNAQVLVTRAWDENEGLFKLSIVTDVNDVRATTVASFEGEEDCSKAFEHFTENDAREHRQHIVKTLN